MATTEQYLNQLQSDKQTLVENLKNKGIEATNEETFTTLVPKVSEIETSGGKYAPRRITFSQYTGEELDSEIANLDTSNITSMAGMFMGSENLKSLDLSNFDTSNVADMSNMFSSCKKLENLDLSNFDTSNVTNMSNMFSTCYKLKNPNIKNWDVRKVVNAGNLFNNCDALGDVNLDNMNFESCTSFGGMFNNCDGTDNVSMKNVNMSKVESLSYFAANMTGRPISLDMTGCDMQSVNNMNVFCSTATNLTNLVLGINLGKGYTQKTNNYTNYALKFSNNNTKLTHDSLMSVINNLYDLNLTYDVTNGGTLYTQQLVLNSTNLAKLTAEEIAIATNKG